MKFSNGTIKYDSAIQLYYHVRCVTAISLYWIYIYIYILILIKNTVDTVSVPSDVCQTLYTADAWIWMIINTLYMCLTGRGVSFHLVGGERQWEAHLLGWLRARCPEMCLWDWAQLHWTQSLLQLRCWPEAVVRFQPSCVLNGIVLFFYDEFIIFVQSLRSLLKQVSLMLTFFKYVSKFSKFSWFELAKTLPSKSLTVLFLFCLLCVLQERRFWNTHV